MKDMASEGLKKRIGVCKLHVVGRSFQAKKTKWSVWRPADSLVCVLQREYGDRAG